MVFHSCCFMQNVYALFLSLFRAAVQKKQSLPSVILGNPYCPFYEDFSIMPTGELRIISPGKQFIAVMINHPHHHEFSERGRHVRCEVQQ